MILKNILEAESELTALIEAVQRGEEVLIGKEGKPVARLVAYRSAPEPRKPGAQKASLQTRESWGCQKPSTRSSGNRDSNCYRLTPDTRTQCSSWIITSDRGWSRTQAQPIQFGVGCSTCSITSVRTGTLRRSNFNPNCDSIASNTSARNSSRASIALGSSCHSALKS